MIRRVNAQNAAGSRNRLEQPLPGVFRLPVLALCLQRTAAYNAAMTQLHLSLLGPFQATVDGRPVAAFPTDKVRGLLAFLALEPDRPHRREALAGLLWPERPEEDARRNLRQSLHRLRTTLDGAAPGLADRLLHADQITVRLDPAALLLDVAEFRRLLAEVEAHRHRTLPTCQPCVERLRQAVDLYRGELLAGLSLPDAPTFEEWQTIQREASHYQAVTALQALAEAYDARRDYDQAHAVALRLLALEPWQEAAHRLAMRGLALSGQRSEALAHYEACRRLLVEELGEEPSAETKALYWQIAAGELQAASDAGRVPLHGCPGQFTRFVGRQRELAELLDLLHNPDCRLITLLGPGGMGKTRLAIEAAQAAAAMTANYPDGVYFVRLEDVPDPDLLAPTLAHGLGLAVEVGQPAQQVAAFLRSRQVLLVLDNFEQHLAGVGLVADLLRAAPGVQIIVTSQAPLDLRAEWRLNLEGLAYPPEEAAPDALEQYDAVQLFAQAARQARPGFAPNAADMTAVAAICRLVQGMPLAIELAAAWVRMAGCAAIAAEIERNLDFLAARLHDLPARQRSVRAVFDYAWRLLSPAEQAVLAQICLLRGNFSLPAALAVCGTGAAELGRLLDRSLVSRAAQDRFTVHPLVRQFGVELLERSGVAEQTRASHAAYFSRIASEWAAGLRGRGDQQAALNALALDVENLIVAWEWATERGDEPVLLAMIHALFDFLTIRSRFREGELILGDGLRRLAAANASDPTRAAVQARLAWFVFHQGRSEEARRLLEESLAVLRTAGDRSGVVFCLSYLGAVQRHAQEYAAAEASLREALTLAHSTGDDYFVGVILNVLGQVASLQGDLDAARAALQRALEVKRRIGDRWGMTFSLSYLGRVAQAEGKHGEAQGLLRESLLLSQEFGDRRGVAFSLFNLGQSAEALGQRAEALALYSQSLHIYTEIGSRADAERARGRLAGLS